MTMNASSSVISRSLALYLRVALGVTFLSAVADRFGLWGPPGSAGVAWGEFDSFLAYTASLVPGLPPGGVPLLGWLVTVGEIGLGIALLLGLKVRLAAGGSGLMLLGFALGMMFGDGLKAPFDASVFSASAGALLLYVHPDSYLSIDGALASGKG